MFYTGVDPLCHESGIPFVFPIHDLNHRIYPNLPEFANDGEAERRDRFYRLATQSAIFTLVDSETGRDQAVSFYGTAGLSPDRVRILPYVPAPEILPPTADERRRIRAAHRLPERFFFYPAQFWPHKNHERIVLALSSLQSRGIRDVHLVFCGSNQGTLRAESFQKVMTSARQGGVEGRIHYLGYVPNRDLAALYAEAAGLVMPTFFGPTNIPVLEAWTLGCPVITSDIAGIREQVGDAALLVDPTSIESIAGALSRIVSEPGLSQELAHRGKARLSLFTPRHFSERLRSIVSDACDQVASGRTPAGKAAP
jgi:glycosyltransferase involved in cell wall biosynthesis